MGYRLFFLIMGYFVDIWKLIGVCLGFVNTMGISKIKVTSHEIDF